MQVQLLRPGDVIDKRYEVVEVLGVGGFGTVYKARQSQFDRFVAVKLLHQTMADSEERARFDREAKAMNALHHRNIVSLYGIGFWNGAPYMVTELAAGPNLFTVLSKCDQMDRSRVVKLIQQILAALSCAHQQGIIHRDLKPSNIILTRDADGSEVVKVIDFGLAKMLPGYGIPSQKLTETGFALGTAQYMSPEQCVGGAVDGRTDLYSTACMMFQCLTGRLPFDAVEAMELMYQHLNAAPPSLTAFLPNDSTTAALQHFCDNCLAKDPDVRYATADEALRDLNAIEMGESKKVKVFAPTSSSRKKRTGSPLEKKSRLSVVVAVAVAAFLCGGGFAVYWLHGLAGEPPRAVADATRGEDLATTVIHSLDTVKGADETEITDQLHDEMLQQLTLDEADHHLTPYHRARLAYLLSLWYQTRDLTQAERWGLVAWGQRKLATTYPGRARNQLIGMFIADGKFEEADELLRQMIKAEDNDSVQMMKSATYGYLSMNRWDHARVMLESILGMSGATPRIREFAYYGLGDASLPQARPRDAERFYQAGSAISHDEIFPNPCWLGVARMAFLRHEPARAHEALKNLLPGDFETNLFPQYYALVLSLADAAWRHDDAGVAVYGKRVGLLRGKWVPDFIDYIASMDDEIAREALRKNGYGDVAASLAPLFDEHARHAYEHARAPKMPKKGAPSST